MLGVFVYSISLYGNNKLQPEIAGVFCFIAMVHCYAYDVSSHLSWDLKHNVFWGDTVEMTKSINASTGMIRCYLKTKPFTEIIVQKWNLNFHFSQLSRIYIYLGLINHKLFAIKGDLLW